MASARTPQGFAWADLIDNARPGLRGSGQNRCRREARSGAFTLVEVTLAIGVAAFSLIAIFGLLPVGINTVDAAVEQSAASNLLSAVVADLRSTPVTLPRGQMTTSQQFRIVIPINPVASSASLSARATTVYVTIDGQPALAADGTPATKPAPDSHFRLTVTFVPNDKLTTVPSGTVTRTPTLAQLTVGWPATATADHPIGSTEQFVILDRN